MNHDSIRVLADIQRSKKSLVCVGLDPDYELLPDILRQMDPVRAVRRFCFDVIDATAEVASAFKLNFAFFEALGPDGWRVLKDVAGHLPAGIFRIADAKRGDIGNSARFYARAVFEDLGFDACTVAPYMGRDSIEPFLQFENKTAFVLARTSNPGASNFQNARINNRPLYLDVAVQTTSWAQSLPGTAGLVVGATDVETLAEIRRTCPEVPFLVPGIGAQGGDLDAVIRTAGAGDGLAVINSSRQILYASRGDDYATAAFREAGRLREKIEGIRSSQMD